MTTEAGAARVLIAEDEVSMRTSITHALERAGVLARSRGSGKGLEELLEGFRPDLVVLDVMLPGRDGFALLRVVRDRGDAGIVMVTARDGLDDRLHGLGTGADDYVVKPFLLAELVSRLRAVLRRRGRISTATTVGDLLVDDEAGVATRRGEPLELTATELRLLRYLAENRGRAVAKNQILTRSSRHARPRAHRGRAEPAPRAGRPAGARRRAGGRGRGGRGRRRRRRRRRGRPVPAGPDARQPAHQRAPPHPAGDAGLGLPIARALARAHGGDLTYRALPDGSAFVLTLPA